MRFLLGLLIGAGLGVSIGLIVAPQPGSETRRALQKRMHRAGDDREDDALGYEVEEEAATIVEEVAGAQPVG